MIAVIGPMAMTGMTWDPGRVVLTGIGARWAKDGLGVGMVAGASMT